MNKRFTPQQMDIFNGQRRTDAGTRAKPGNMFLNPSTGSTERGFKKVQNARQVELALSKFRGVEREIAQCALRVVLRTKGFVSRKGLISSTYALMATKNPAIKEMQVGDVILKFALNKGFIRTYKKVVVK